MRGTVLAHQRMCLKGASHRGVWIVRGKQLPIILDEFRVRGLGQHRAPNRLDGHHRIMGAGLSVKAVGVSGKVIDRNLIINRW
jgi:hypothetical protein